MPSVRLLRLHIYLLYKIELLRTVLPLYLILMLLVISHPTHLQHLHIISYWNKINFLFDAVWETARFHLRNYFGEILRRRVRQNGILYDNKYVE